MPNYAAVRYRNCLVLYCMNRELVSGRGRNRKGVSPLIAAVLLIAFTMAVAAILTAWVTTFTQDTASQVGNESEQLISCSYAGVSVFDANWDGSNVDVTVANTGTVDLNNVSIYAFRDASIQGQAFITNLESGAIDSGTISSVSQIPDRIRISTRDCPDTTAEENQISDSS